MIAYFDRAIPGSNRYLAGTINPAAMKFNSRLARKMETLASSVIRMTGSNMALIFCFGIVILWGIDGFFTHFSQRWETLISTVSGVITVLMVFLIQKAQSKDSLAIQLKLNELVAAHELASNRLVDVEGMTEEELRVLQKYYTKLSKFAKEQDTLNESHSIDEKREEHAIREELERELDNLSQSNPSDTKEKDTRL